jgi:hypothetical protein
MALAPATLIRRAATRTATWQVFATGKGKASPHAGSLRNLWDLLYFLTGRIGVRLIHEGSASDDI